MVFDSGWFLGVLMIIIGHIPFMYISGASTLVIISVTGMALFFLGILWMFSHEEYQKKIGDFVQITD